MPAVRRRGEAPLQSLTRVAVERANCRATRHSREPPSDGEIERGLRERAVSDPRAAEILLRWLQRPRVDERVGGVDLDLMSERELGQLHAGLVRLALLDETALAALVEHVLGDDKASRSFTFGRRRTSPHGFRLVEGF